MEFELRNKELKNCVTCDTIEIVYNGKVYGEWDENANIDYPEDLTLKRDLNELIQIGIKIGKQMERDSNEKIELKTNKIWSDKPDDGNGLYKIKTKDGNIKLAIIHGEGEYIRIIEVHNGWDSESINHPIYEGAKFLGTFK